MTANPYTHLGFNPAPGTVTTVSDLAAKLKKSAETISAAHRMIEKLRGGTSWEGDAAVAFRQELDGALPTNLKNAHTSITKAATALSSWQSALSGYQDRAETLDGEAKAAKEKLSTAEGREKAASGHPDLKLAGQTFTEGAELRNAQSRLDRATEALNDARTAVANARSAYDTVIKRAHELQAEHASDARGRAHTIRDATDKLAPEEPGWFDNFVDWFDENITDILGAVAAITGLIAIFCLAPAGPILLLIAAAASAGALATRASNPVVWASLKDGFTKREFDSDFWSNAVGLGGDLLGVIPGASAVARGAVGASRAASVGGQVLSLGDRLSSTGSKTLLTADRIRNAPNPLTSWLVKGASDPKVAADIVDGSVSGAGALTATYGVAKNIWEDIKDPTVEDTATGMDGLRAGSFDGAGNVNALIKTVRLLTR